LAIRGGNFAGTTKQDFRRWADRMATTEINTHQANYAADEVGGLVDRRNGDR
jgi:hypothetical protein